MQQIHNRGTWLSKCNNLYFKSVLARQWTSWCCWCVLEFLCFVKIMPRADLHTWKFHIRHFLCVKTSLHSSHIHAYTWPLPREIIGWFDVVSWIHDIIKIWLWNKADEFAYVTCKYVGRDLNKWLVKCARAITSTENQREPEKQPIQTGERGLSRVYTYSHKWLFRSTVQIYYYQYFVFKVVNACTIYYHDTGKRGKHWSDLAYKT